MKVITISGKAGSGKDTFAKELAGALKRKGKSVFITHFADYLKFICREWFDWDGKKDLYGRTLLQYVGTDRVRADCPDFWAYNLAELLSVFKDRWDVVIIPDCRFPNEPETLRQFDHDVTTVYIERPDGRSALTQEQKLHPSENAIKADDCRYTLTNTTFASLAKQANSLADDLFPRSGFTVLVDVDDVAMDLCGAWCEYLNAHYGTDVEPSHLTSWDMRDNFPTLTEKEIFGALRDPDLFRSEGMVFGAAAAIQKLTEAGADVYFVTATHYKTPKAKFKRLFAFFGGIVDPSRLIVCHDKRMVRGSVLIDDNPDNLKGGEYRKILFDRPHNRGFDEKTIGAERAEDWSAVVRLVLNMINKKKE